MKLAEETIAALEKQILKIKRFVDKHKMKPVNQDKVLEHLMKQNNNCNKIIKWLIKHYDSFLLQASFNCCGYVRIIFTVAPPNLC